MQQRLGIAQALVGEPRLLLLDEPTSALDPVGRRIVRDLLEELRGRGVAVLLNSHLLSEVELVCDRVAIIDHGELVAAGRPDELARPRGVEVETAAGTRASRAPAATTCPRIVGASWPPASASTACAVRSTLEDAYLEVVEPERRRDAPVVAAHALREALRRRVFPVVLVLTLASARSTRGAPRAVQRRHAASAATSSASTRGRSPARPCSASRCSARSSSAPCWRCSSRSA